MDLSQHTVLVTGGASGIGLALASRFLRAGSEVIVCGRRADKLAEAARAHHGLRTIGADVAREPDRRALIDRVASEYPRFDVLVNNAGIQRRVDLGSGRAWADTREEIAVNLEAPLHLAELVIPIFRDRAHPAIVNVTSGLSFVPLADVPIYCATKAALHSFTLSLRHQLRDTPIEVVEIIPPAVDTDLGGPGLHTFGVPVDEFADAAMSEIAAGALETAYGFSKQTSRAGRPELDAAFQRMNRR